MKTIVLAMIRLYQRCLSPCKGFRCAYSVYSGRCGCSGLGYRAIRRHGVWHGYLILRRRLEKCGIAHRRLQKRRAYLQTQAGFCDLPCDIPCDLDAVDIASEVCDCSCDWPSRKEKAADGEVHLPPGR